MNLVVAAEISELARLHSSVCQFCTEHGLSAEIEGDLSLALEEIVINVIRHGHPEGGKHQIGVGLSLEGDCVIATVEDDGIPFNPIQAPEPDMDRPIQERPIGGLGIHLVKYLMDQLEYRRSGGRNRLVLRKGIPKSK